jgi:outer membrane protein assembly factor BamB
MSSCSVHDGLCYAADLGGYVHCLDADTGKEYWEHDMQAACWTSPYWVDGKVYLGNDDGDMYIFAHGKEKKQLGQVAMDRPIKGTPVAVNGVLYVVAEGQLFAIASK